LGSKLKVNHLRSHLLVWSTEDYVFLEGKIPRTPSSKVKNDINITRVMSRCSDHFTFVWDELTSSS
ncbi:MAG: hypothetical protein ACI81C_003349, partial [Alteromonas macleodii]